MEDQKQPKEMNEIKAIKSGKDSIPGILIRLILSVVTGAIIGSVIYFSAVGSIPYLDQRVFQPLKNNQADVTNLQADQESHKQQLSSLQAQLESVNATLEMSLAQIGEDNLSLQVTADANSQSVLTLYRSLTDLEISLDSVNRNLSALATAQMRSTDFQQRISLLKILDLLTLANQYLLHNNFGQAENQLLLVKIELEALFIQSPAFYQSYILDLLSLVDQAVQDLPDNSYLAEGEIQLARQMALQGFPELEITGTITATPYVIPTFTPTP